MPLEPEIETFIAESEAFLPPGYVTAPLAEQRRLYDDLCRAYDFGRPAGVTVEDRRVPGPGGEVPVRICRPAGGGLRAGLVFMHGQVGATFDAKIVGLGDPAALAESLEA